MPYSPKNLEDWAVNKIFHSKDESVCERPIEKKELGGKIESEKKKK